MRRILLTLAKLLAVIAALSCCAGAPGQKAPGNTAI